MTHEINDLYTLAKIAVASSLGNFDDVEKAIREGKKNNVPAVKMYEAVVHLITHAGYPKAVNAARSFANVFPDYIKERDGDKPKALEKWSEFAQSIWSERGHAIYNGHWKGDAGAKIMEELNKICPEIPDWVIPDAYGRIYGRPGLSMAEHETVVSFIVCPQGAPKEMSLHFQGLVDQGITKEMIVDILQNLDDVMSKKEIAELIEVIKSM
ncbi:MAG: hypothetical protein J7L90_04445 [Dehalococcoidia bacterium]|nr:hypothetical protein [Dehalococcoidia bacterium]